ncbi:hypothetical protein [Tolypothrix sp. VBCCA 56010]|uniref:hypothetical protein n=1 Tax=Tolypothrix sp. VBCCA 56010 TaxID=3137731 RepID=UPI003D7E0A5E
MMVLCDRIFDDRIILSDRTLDDTLISCDAYGGKLRTFSRHDDFGRSPIYIHITKSAMPTAVNYALSVT